MGRLLLLLHDHVLHVLSPLVLLALLLHVSLPNSFFISFRFQSCLLLPLLRAHLAISDSLVRLLLASPVLLPLNILLHLLVLEALLFLLLSIDVPLALRYDLAGTLAGFINFLHDLALLHFQESNTVAKKFKVFLGSLTSYLRCTELLV